MSRGNRNQEAKAAVGVQMESGRPFMGAGPDYAGARVVLFGVPMDFTTSFRAGTRLGPTRIREASYGLEEYSLALGADLGDVPFYDLGDLVLPLGNVNASLDRTRRLAKKVLADGKVPFALGGEHLVTLPLVEAAAERHPDLVVVQLDAHADLRDTYLGERFSHATVMRRVVEVVGAGKVFQVGVRSATRSEAQYARAKTRFFPEEVLGPLEEVLPCLAGRPVYFTLDIDVVDPAFAPGTGAPEPGGPGPREVIQAVRELASVASAASTPGAPGRSFQVVGLDLVEVSPPYDTGEITVILAAKLVREALLALCGSGSKD